MQRFEDTLRDQIALGWITNLVVGCLMFVFMTMESAIADNHFKVLKFDPGAQGLKVLVFLVPVYALMPIFVYVVHELRLRVLRWIAVVTASLGLLFFLLHHMSHWYFGSRPDLASHMIDLTLHTVGLWVLINSVRWALAPPPSASPVVVAS
jgi:hypothetical protein